MAEAVSCRSVHGFLLSKDGRLRLKAAVPGAAVAFRAVDPDSAAALFEAMYGGAPLVVPPAACAAAVPECVGAAACVAIPLAGTDGPHGVAVAALSVAASERDLACLAALGEATAACIESARATEVLARRAHASERTVRRLVAGVLECGAASFVLDLDGRVLKWSRGAAERFGWTEHEVRGSRLPVAGEPARCAVILRTKAAADVPFRLSFELKRRDGAVERVDATGAAIAREDEDASAVLIVCHEPRSATSDTDSLRQAYLAALVERELASPLTALKGYAELLTRPSIAEDGAQRARVARALSERAREVERVLTDLALLSGLERGSGLIVESVDVSSLIAEVARRVNANHGRDVFVVDGRAGARALIDRVCAERSLEGLFRCIASASPCAEEGVLVSVRHDGNAVEVVLDTPSGRPEVGDADAPTYPFTEAGIGFHLARMVAEAHGGDVWLDAADTGRSRIGIRLPAHEGDEETAWLVPMV